MCDSYEVGKVVGNSLYEKGRSAREVFPRQTAIIEPERVTPEHCAFSGQSLSKDEREPSDAITKRHLKDREYQAIIGRQDKSLCAMCGERLPDWKVEQAYQYPREVHNNFCDLCRDYFCLLAAAVHGDEKAYCVLHGQEGVYRSPQPQPAITYEPMQTVGDIIDMQPVRKAEPVYIRR